MPSGLNNRRRALASDRQGQRGLSQPGTATAAGIITVDSCSKACRRYWFFNIYDVRELGVAGRETMCVKERKSGEEWVFLGVWWVN